MLRTQNVGPIFYPVCSCIMEGYICGAWICTCKMSTYICSNSCLFQISVNISVFLYKFKI